MCFYLLHLTQSPDFTYKRVIYANVRCHCKNKYVFIDLFMFSQTYKKKLSAESVDKKACHSMFKPKKEPTVWPILSDEKIFHRLSINKLLTCCFLEGRIIIKGAEGRKILHQILDIDYVKCWSGIVFSVSLATLCPGHCIWQGCASARDLRYLKSSKHLKNRLKTYCFPHIKSLQLFSWEMLCAFDHNLDLHFLTLENFAKLTRFTVGFLCLFCCGFYNSYKCSINYSLTHIINCGDLGSMELSCIINFSRIRCISSIPRLSSLQCDLKCMHQLKLELGKYNPVRFYSYSQICSPSIVFLQLPHIDVWNGTLHNLNVSFLLCKKLNCQPTKSHF